MPDRRFFDKATGVHVDLVVTPPRWQSLTPGEMGAAIAAAIEAWPVAAIRANRHELVVAVLLPADDVIAPADLAKRRERIKADIVAAVDMERLRK